MMSWWKRVSTKHPWRVIGVASLAVVLAAWYGLGLFGAIKNSDDMAVSGTESAAARAAIEQHFGTTGQTEIVLVERVDAGLGTVESPEYQAELQRLFAPLRSAVETVNTYADQPNPALVSRSHTATYAVIVGKGNDAAAISKVLSDFVTAADQSKLKLSVGGTSTTVTQMSQRVGHDLERAELMTFPLLLILLMVFFGSTVAAIIPLGMSAVTIVGAFAVARLMTHVLTIDSYAVNVITILGIGLSIDYALLSVSRFREELRHGSVEHAVRTVVSTSGRTIFFSGVTVIVCLLTLLVFPLEFLHSIAIGSASAILVAVLLTVVVLPSILMVLGKRINAWHLPFIRQHTGESKLWSRLARFVTRRPLVTLVAGLVVIALALVPLGRLIIAGTMDYHYLTRGVSSRYVAEKLATEFTIKSPTMTAIMTLPPGVSETDRLQISCNMTTQLQNISGVSAVVSATPVGATLSCDQLKQAVQYGVASPQLQGLLHGFMREQALSFSLTTTDKAGTHAADTALEATRNLHPAKGEWLVGGSAALSYDTNHVYAERIPIALAIIVIAMIVLLSIQLGSVIIPIQAIVINMISLAISFAVLVGIFQLGWIDGLTGWGTVEGVVMTPLVLVAAIAFGLAMDYSVFLYSRMHEIYQKTGDAKKAVIDGIVRTGPIITAAALMVFVVVVAFAGSSVAIMQMIGIGLAVAVLVDAFFVRLILVPSIMILMGRASWLAPSWLKKLQITHD